MKLPSSVQQSAPEANAGPQLFTPHNKSPAQSSCVSCASQSPSDSPQGFSDVQHEPS